MEYVIEHYQSYETLYAIVLIMWLELKKGNLYWKQKKIEE